MQRQRQAQHFNVLCRKGISLLLVFVLLIGIFPTVARAASETLTITTSAVTGTGITRLENKSITASSTSSMLPSKTASLIYVATVNDTDATLTNSTGFKWTASFNAYLTTSDRCIILNNNASKTISYLESYKHGFSVTKDELVTAGFTDEELNNQATAYYYAHFDFTAKSGSVFGLLIQVVQTQTVSKTELENALSGLNLPTAGYYTENDRWNGTTTSENGFWADLQELVKPAQDVLNNDDATQGEVDAQVAYLTSGETKAKLESAIANLIPITQINPTALYEALQNSERLCWKGDGDGGYNAAVAPENFNGEFITRNDTSVATWSALQAAVTEGQLLLDSLYDSDGTPTEANDSSNETLVSQVSAAAAAINTAIGNLDKRADEYALADSKLALAGIDLYANTLYDPARLTQENYTAESWNAFVEARTMALTVLESGKTFDGMGDDVVRAQGNAFQQLRQACYGLVEKAETITVHFSAVDNYAVRKNKASMSVNTCELTLTENRTIADALRAAEVTLSTSGKANSAVGVYLNGVYLTQYSRVNGNSPMLWPNYYSSYELRDGDELTVVLMAPPLETNLSGATGAKKMFAVGDYLQYQTIQVADGAKEAGKAFNITVTADGALATNRAGTASPVSGAAVYVSEVCETEAAARTAPITTDTGAVTDANGVASVQLYAEGWYALNVFDLTENGGLTNGQTVLVQVEAAADTDSVKAELKSELVSLAAVYPENFFTSEQWETIQTAKDTALVAIDAANTTKDAYTAQQTAMNTIQSVQSAAASENTRNLQSFRFNLSKLPEDLSKLDQSSKNAVDGVIRCYEAMTGYQREQLTPLEVSTYEQIKELNERGLPEATAYQLTVKYDFSGIPETDRADLEAMLTYLKANTGYEGKRDVLGGEKMAELYSFNTTANSASLGGTVFTPVTEAYGGTSVTFCSSPEYATHALIRGNRQTYDRNGDTYGTSLTDADYILQNGNWSIQDTSTAEVTSTTFDLKASRIYTVNGNSYEMRGIAVEGLDESDLTSTQYGFFDFSDYLGKSQTNQTFISIADSFRNFTMPFNDVTFTVIWAPVGGTVDEISAAKEAAKSAIETAYAGYSQSDYSEENWTVLTQAKTNGIAAVESAATADAVRIARQSALAAMAAVKKLSSGSGSGTSGTPEVELPDYGKTVGQVYVSVENNTYPGGDFTGTILAGWYDLCEQDTMMTCILKALKTEGFTWSGTGGTEYGITYLASISKDGKKLGEFDGEPGSGWMGTLNDWFTNEGFASFGVENGKLENGDIINVVYTQNLGVDVGGTWGNSDTSLSALEITGGTLTPGFDGDTLTYSLTIPGDTATITVTPTAANKNYLVKTFLNSYNSDAAFYKRTESISVKSGDTIYVGVGEKAWPSMNNQGEEARDYTGTKYTIKVYSGGKDGVQAQIDALPDAGKITLSNYKSYQESVASIRAAYDALNDKTGVTITKLTDAEAAIKKFQEIDNVKSLLAALPSSASTSDTQVKSAKSAIEKADRAYKALSDEQKGYITVGDVANYNALVERLAKLTTTSASSITGSETIPGSSLVEPEATVKGDSATAAVTDKQITSAIDAVKDSGENTITIAPTGTDKAKEVTVQLSKSAAQSIVKDTDAALSIETDKGTVTIPNDALKSINEQASGSNIQIIVAEKSASDVTDKSINTENAVIVEVTVKSGDKTITSFGGKSLTISIPAGSKHVEGQNYKVIEISADGTQKVLTGKCVKVDGKLVIQVSTTGLSTFVATTQKTLSFTDVKESDYYYEPVKWAVEKGITNGTTATTFSPDAGCTRAQMVTFLWRAAGSPEPSGKTNPFSDVDENAYYFKALLWAVENGITNGTSATTFSPDAVCTRGQMAAFLYRNAKTPAVSGSTSFTDVTDGDYFSDAVVWAAQEGITVGTSDTTFSPAADCTRGQMVTFLYRYLAD